MTVRRTNPLRLALIDEALARVRFHFQPIVSGRRLNVNGYEALARPRAGGSGGAGSGPKGFVAAARRLGRSHALAAALLRAGSEALALLPAPQRLFINVSRGDLEHGLLLALAPVASRVVLEVDQNECAGMRRESVAEYRRCGFRFAADDLRAGRGAHAAIAALEPQIYKLDRSLLRGIREEPLRRAAIRRLLEIAGRNGAEVVCEGIERPFERVILLDLGADLMQGFLFGVARPLGSRRGGRGTPS